MFAQFFGLTPMSPEDDGRVAIIDPATARQWVEAGEAVVVDVREFNEHVTERIPGAMLNPLSMFDPASVPELPAGRKLLVHCRTGARCGLAAMRLLAAGYKGPVHRLQGGIMGWKGAGGAIAGGPVQ